MTGCNGGIWYVHPYAGGPGLGRLGRPFELARRWQSLGVPAIVFTSSFHHSLDRPRQPGSSDISGVPYEFVEAPVYDGNGVGRVRNMAAFAVNFWRNARRYVQTYGRPGLIIGSSPHPYVFPATHRVARTFDSISAFEVRDLWPLSLVELAGVTAYHPLIALTAALERFAYRRADHVVSLLPKTFDHMKARGLSAERWCYIPNGIDVSGLPARTIESAPYAAMREWQRAGRSVIVYAGALGRPNNVGTLVNAMARLRGAKSTALAALIVGRGEEAATIGQAIADNDLQDRIAIFDQIPKDAALSLLAHADAGYFSLHHSPVFRFGVSPNKLFDYMLCGIPVVSSLAAGNDPVAEADCGFVVAPNEPDALVDALRRLDAMPKNERSAMGARGRDFVLAKHDYDRLARDYLTLAEPSSATLIANRP